MPFHLRGDIQDFFPVEGLTHQQVRKEYAGSKCRRAAAEASGKGDTVDEVHAAAGDLFPCLLGRFRHRLNDHVIHSGRDLVCAFPFCADHGILELSSFLGDELDDIIKAE